MLVGATQTDSAGDVVAVAHKSTGTLYRAHYYNYAVVVVGWQALYAYHNNSNNCPTK